MTENPRHAALQSRIRYHVAAVRRCAPTDSGERERGFTIMELLIATLLFSVILLIVTSGILQVTRTYYKGVTESNTQTAARTVIDTIAQAIQFDGGAVQPNTAGSVPNTSYAMCVGNVRFRYLLGSELSDSPASGQTYHALLEDTVSGCTSGLTSPSINAATATGTELLSPHMRLSNLTVTPLGNDLYTISVRVVYGDDDLLLNPNGSNAMCQGIEAGSQFCSMASLSTTVLKRVQ